jgi:hypothetical protein
VLGGASSVRSPAMTSVSVAPGHTQFARTPPGPKVVARSLVNVATADLSVA